MASLETCNHELFKNGLLSTFWHELCARGNRLSLLPRHHVESSASHFLAATCEDDAQSDEAIEGVVEYLVSHQVTPEDCVAAAHLLAETARDHLELADMVTSSVEAAGILHRFNSVLLRCLVRASEPYTTHLVREVATARHDERRRIAADIHDKIASQVGLSLQQFDLIEVRLGESLPDCARTQLVSVRETLVGASDVIHDLGGQLGGRQTEIGFVKAIDRFVGAYGDGRVTVHAPEPDAIEALPAWVLEEFFYAVREAISNAIKHSGSSNIDVTFDISGQQFGARIEDDGAGVDPTSVSGSELGRGLSTLRERLAFLGGTSELTTEAGRGTVMDLRVPTP